jgi:hypothetical protein
MSDLIKITVQTLIIMAIILAVIYGTAIFGEWVIGVFNTIRHALFF